MRSRTLISLAVAGVAALAATSYATDPYPWGFSSQTSGGLVTYPQATHSGATDVTWYFPDGSVARLATTSDSALTVTWYWTYPDGSFAEQTTTADGVPISVAWFNLNGTIARQSMTQDGTPGAITWSYPDGTVAYQMAADAVPTIEYTGYWYYPDGSLETAESTSVITWYYPDGLILEQHGSTYVVVQGPRVS